MTQSIIKTEDYLAFIQDIKQRIQGAQIKASVAVNQALLQLYWELAERIVAKQQDSAWGDGFLLQMSRDLQTEFPEMKGFSPRNLKYMRQWFQFWTVGSSIGQQLVAQLDKPAIAQQLVAQLDKPISQQLAGPITQIPWGHNLVIISKIKTTEQALFYVQKTIQNNWSRAVLTHQIESGLHLREGKAVTNFQTTLPAPHSDLARQMLKDPYHFDFLILKERHDEQELENALIEHITRFLLELGAGFSYLGRQYKLEVDGDEFFIDLLFYHVRLHCYVVVELKTVKFKPEFAGKLNFYISAVDDMLKTGQDSPTIGILICKSKKDTVVEYALRNINKPIGVSEYTITQNLPEELKSSLPSIEEIEAELGGGDE
ncbi:MAG: PDDEXK nuclease domain-containing protein [Gallionella sp.]|nr:PDDEXK nuclease domain-containing protein [Gallionella sp.]